jgi:DNA-binding transcriptional ArsR family regulator
VLTAELNRTFAALVDPTRRAILLQLARKGEVSVGELAKPFDIKLPAVTKHLGILHDAGLVTRTKVGRTVYCRLSPAGLTRASRWIDQTTSFWETRLDNLTHAMEKHRARR